DHRRQHPIAEFLASQRQVVDSTTTPPPRKMKKVGRNACGQPLQTQNMPAQACHHGKRHHGLD
ncbi:hypothetical protein, partial [Vogesella fluminis]|uniref:hypothetical protein n=1 Tax=Vogesella fluminis TaxID=1069161 RepID=UPI001E5AB4FB